MVSPGVEALTEREIEIVRAIANSVPRKVICDSVGIAKSRLDDVVGQICVKLKINKSLVRAATLTLWAVRNGLVDVNDDCRCRPG